MYANNRLTAFFYNFGLPMMRTELRNKLFENAFRSKISFNLNMLLFFIKLKQK